MLIFVISINNYFWTFVLHNFWNFFLILPCTLTIKVRVFFLMCSPWKVGLGTWITLPYLNSKCKIKGLGPPPSILEKKHNRDTRLRLYESMVGIIGQTAIKETTLCNICNRPFFSESILINNTCFILIILLSVY